MDAIMDDLLKYNCDLIIFRHVIQHLNIIDAQKAIENIYRSKCKYLFINHQRNLDKNIDKKINEVGWQNQMYNLNIEPFNLGVNEIYHIKDLDKHVIDRGQGESYSLYNIIKNFEIVNYIYNSKICIFNHYNDVLSNIIREGNIWEEHLIDLGKKFINKNSVVLEGGGNLGTHTLLYSKLAEKVYVFEPMELTNKLLNNTIKINNLNNVIISDKGLSNKNEYQFWSWACPDNIAASGLKGGSLGPHSKHNVEFKGIDNTKPVELITIDSLNLEKLDFIKLDVEGYEVKAIEGGLNTIKKLKPVIVLEHWNSHCGDTSLVNVKNTYKFLLDIGYSVQQISGPDFIITSDLILTFKPK